MVSEAGADAADAADAAGLLADKDVATVQRPDPCQVDVPGAPQEHRRQEREDQKDPLHRPPSELFSREEAAEARQNWLEAADLRTTVDSLDPGYNGPSFLCD